MPAVPWHHRPVAERLAGGTPAPAFSLADQDGTEVSLAGFVGRSVLVVGISPDAPAALARFATRHSLGFTLLSDPDHAVAEAWGVWGERSMYGRTYMGVIRSAFLVGPDGTLLCAWYKVSPKDIPKKLLAALKV